MCDVSGGSGLRRGARWGGSRGGGAAEDLGKEVLSRWNSGCPIQRRGADNLVAQKIGLKPVSVCSYAGRIAILTSFPGLTEPTGLFSLTA